MIRGSKAPNDTMAVPAASPGGSFSEWFDQRAQAAPTASQPSIANSMLSSFWKGSSGTNGDLESGTRNRDDGEGVTEGSSFIPAFMRPGSSPPPATGVLATLFGSDGNCGLALTQRIQLGMMLMLASVVLMGMAVFVYLPWAILAPLKFSSSLAFSSILFISAICCFSGVRSTLVGMCQREKALVVAAYVISLVSTLYFTSAAPSYPLLLVCTIFQIAAIAWFAASFVPGGMAAMSFITRGCFSGAMSGGRGLLFRAIR
jgi:hypothetical protein